MPKIEGPVTMGPEASKEDQDKVGKAVYDQLHDSSVVKQLTKAGNKATNVDIGKAKKKTKRK